MMMLPDGGETADTVNKNHIAIEPEGETSGFSPKVDEAVNGVGKVEDGMFFYFILLSQLAAFLGWIHSGALGLPSTTLERSETCYCSTTL